MGVGAPHGGFDGPQQAPPDESHGFEQGPQGPQGPHGPQGPQGPQGPHGDGPQRVFLLTPIVILANRNGNDAGQQLGVGRHIQAERP